MDSTRCGESYGCLKFLKKEGAKVFVVKCRGYGAFRGVMLGGLRK